MNAKQVVAVILISASTAVATMWGYNRITGSDKVYLYGQDSGKVPSNYAKFFEEQNHSGPGPIDFTDAASAAIPATVHIKTKTVRTVSNNLPHHNPFFRSFWHRPR